MAERRLRGDKLLDVPRTRFVTSPYILMECANSVARTRFRAEVCVLRDRLIGQKDLIDPSASELEEAWLAYRRDAAGGASIVDHISFVVMRRLGITDVFSNDRHFRTAGFHTLF
jgi:predicted nucleic acid-binding protein